MAKQSGIHQIRGKVGQMSYYRQKDVPTGLVRSINQGMSTRVKEDAAFANTRLNAAEFGAAGSFAGALVRSISQRWRTILNPFTTGQLVKPILDELKSDTTHPWGQRVFTDETWKPVVMSALQEHSKKQYSEYYTTDVTVAVTQASGGGYDWTIGGGVTAQDSQNLLAVGAEGVIYEFYSYRANFGLYFPQYSAYGKSVSVLQKLDDADCEIGQVSDFSTSAKSFATSADANILTAMLVVAKPYKVVSNVKHVLQEYCSFMFVTPA